MKYINRRESPRIDVRLNCQVLSGQKRPRGTFVTENISRSGILMLWNENAGCVLPEVGELVTVEIELPAYHGFGRKCIHCQATVVRVSTSENDGARVALSVNYMKFRNYRDRISALHRIQPSEVEKWTS